MRTPIEIWLVDHKNIIEHADRLVELLAPDDIQAKITEPSGRKIRDAIISHLEAFVEITDTHYRDEETLLLPAIIKHLDRNRPKIKNALGCLAREHDQMHKYADRIKILLPMLRSDDKLEKNIAAEILRISYAAQTLIRNHSAMEEKEVYPLIGELPMKVVSSIFESIDSGRDMNIDHLIKPLYGRDKEEDEVKEEEEREFKFGSDGMDFYKSDSSDASGPEN